MAFIGPEIGGDEDCQQMAWNKVIQQQVCVAVVDADAVATATDATGQSCFIF